eukprot:1155354-Pelagomonas_calceolata.AAC.3
MHFRNCCRTSKLCCSWLNLLDELASPIGNLRSKGNQILQECLSLTQSPIEFTRSARLFMIMPFHCLLCLSCLERNVHALP